MSADQIRYRVFLDAFAERAAHDAKWGGPDDHRDCCHPDKPNGDRLRMLAEEFGEVAEAMGRTEDGNGKHDLRAELIQVAAVALAWVEGLDLAQEGEPDVR